jgi:hypothetical protein
MTSKTCGECQWYDDQHLLCVVGGDVEPTDCACEEFIAKTITNGDKIRQKSNEELVDTIDELAFKFSSKREFLAWLNSPAESRVGR